VNYRTGKNIPKVHGKSHKKRSGRPQDQQKLEAFLKVVTFLEENDDEQTTITDLTDMMNQHLENTDSTAYTPSHMKSRLLEHFGDRILITEINGKSNVVTFRTTAQAVLHEFHSQQKSNTPEQEKMSIIEAAAKFIREDIKSVPSSNSHYPSFREIESEEENLNFLPKSLRFLLQEIIKRKNVGVQTASIGQAIMQVTRPRVLVAPLQLGVGVQVHHHFASRFLNDSLHVHGSCSPYAEVKKFEQNAAVHHGTRFPGVKF